MNQVETEHVTPKCHTRLTVHRVPPPIQFVICSGYSSGVTQETDSNRPTSPSLKRQTPRTRPCQWFMYEANNTSEHHRHQTSAVDQQAGCVKRQQRSPEQKVADMMRQNSSNSHNNITGNFNNHDNNSRRETSVASSLKSYHPILIEKTSKMSEHMTELMRKKLVCNRISIHNLMNWKRSQFLLMLIFLHTTIATQQREMWGEIHVSFFEWCLWRKLNWTNRFFNK